MALRLFKEMDRQLAQRNLFVKKGTLLDATIVEAQAKRPSLRGRRPGAPSETDPDARFTRQRGVSQFGYKAHVGWMQGQG